MWWLIVCIILIGLNDAQINDKYDFWVCLYVSPEEVSIWVSRRSKDHPEQCGSATSKPLETWIEQKDRGRVKLGDPSSPAFGRWCSRFLGFLTQTELHHWLSWFSRLQTEDCGTSQPPNSCESIAIKKKNLYLLIYRSISIHILLVLVFWRF